MSEFKYVGSELDLFADVWNWKAYWSRHIRPFLRGDILEVGAGIGSNTRFLDPDGGTGRWVCLEPDPELHGLLVKTFAETKPRRAYETVCGTLASLTDQQFDTIIYIDVLEHIAPSAWRSPHRPIARAPAPLFAVRCRDWTFPAVQSPDAAKHFSAKPAPGTTGLS
jgi:hypothetical protein